MYPSQSERGARVLTVMRVDHGEYDGEDEHDDDDDDAPRDTRRLTAAPSTKAQQTWAISHVIFTV